MKSAVLTGIRKIEIREIPSPQLENKADVLLKPAVIGICGSDLHYYLKDRVGDQVVQYPWTLGHECSALVERVGRRVTRLKPGDKVAVDPAVSCKKCDQCLAGRPHTCRNLRFLGYPGQREGCLSEFTVMPEGNCYPLPEGMTLVQGALVEPLSIGIYSVQLAEDIKDKSIGILGSGSIGLSVLLATKASGAGSVYMTDKIDERVYTAKKAGADWAANPDQSDIIKDIQAEEPSGLDIVFECCGDQAALDQALELLKPGGKLLILGIPMAPRVSFEISKLRRKEISVQNVRRQNRCIEAAIGLIANKKVHVNFMATHFFKLEETLKAFEIASGYQDGVIKAMITLT